MENETNFRRAKMNINSGLTKSCENEQPARPGQNETNLAPLACPRSKAEIPGLTRNPERLTPDLIMQNEPNFRRAKMNINSALTKDYENEQPAGCANLGLPNGLFNH